MLDGCLTGVITALGASAAAVIVAVATLVKALALARKTRRNAARIGALEKKTNGGGDSQLPKDAAS